MPSHPDRSGGIATLPRRPRRSHRRARPRGPRIAGLTVADSAQTLSQRDVLERLGLAGDEFAERIFARCGVEHRHLDLSEEFLDRPLQARNAQIEQQLMTHSTTAVDALGIDPARISTVLSASLYSLGGPTLAHRLIEHYGMSPTTDKYHVTGVGCASAVPLMRLAAQTLHAQPGGQALIVAAESMSGLFSRAVPGEPRAKVVGASIFGDGCAAALLSDDPGAEGPALISSQVHQIPGTLDAVCMDEAAGDVYLHLARELPDLAGADLGGVVDGFLARNRLARGEIDHWVVHPGGRRIVESVQDALALSDEQVATSWDALAAHGNIGTPSILYVLKDAIERSDPRPGEHALMVTIGPGITAGLALLSW